MKNVVRLVALSKFSNKNGKQFFKVMLKKKNSDGIPVLKEFFLPVDVGDYCCEHNLVEDLDVRVELGFDEYMRPGIIGIFPISKEEEILPSNDIF